MQNIVRRNLHPNSCVDRNNDFSVGLKEPFRILDIIVFAKFRELVVRNHVGGKSELAMIRIFILPVPLVADRLNRHIRLRHDISFIKQLERRHRDYYQYNNRNDRPNHFQRRMMRCL